MMRRFYLIILLVLSLIIFQGCSLEQTSEFQECEKEIINNNGSDFSCYISLAINESNSTICNKISDSDFRDDCYISYSKEKQDINSCEKIDNSKLADMCFFNSTIKLNNSQYCNNIYNTTLSDDCFIRLALDNNKLNLCEKTKEKTLDCYQQFIDKSNNVSICNEFPIELNLLCTINMSIKLNNISVCNNFENEYLKKKCYFESIKELKNKSICDDLNDTNKYFCLKEYIFYSDEEVELNSFPTETVWLKNIDGKFKYLKYEWIEERNPNYLFSAFNIDETIYLKVNEIDSRFYSTEEYTAHMKDEGLNNIKSSDNITSVRGTEITINSRPYYRLNYFESVDNLTVYVEEYIYIVNNKLLAFSFLGIDKETIRQNEFTITNILNSVNITEIKYLRPGIDIPNWDIPDFDYEIINPAIPNDIPSIEEYYETNYESTSYEDPKNEFTAIDLAEMRAEESSGDYVYADRDTADMILDRNGFD